MPLTTTTGKSFLTGLMACTMWAGFATHAHAAADSKAVTSWQVSRVASVSQGSYCAMAQKFDNEAIMTFAQNAEGEYSLAIESPKAKFDAAKNTEVNLYVGSGSEATYNARVQSPQAIVIGLGKGDGIVDKLKKSAILHVKIADKKTSYQFENYSAGQKDLGVCIAGIKSPSGDTVTNKSNSKVAADTEPAAGASSAEPSVEGLLAAKPSTSDDKEGLDRRVANAVPASAVPLGIPTVKPADVNIIETTMDNEITELRAENARLKRSLSESRKAYEDQQAKQSGSAVDEMKAKLATLQDENARLSADLDKAKDMGKSSKDDDDKLASLSDELTRIKQNAETLKAENATLRNQIAIAAKVGDKGTQASSEMSAQLSELKAENAKLALEVESLKKIGGGMTPDNLHVQQSMKGLEDRIAILRTENADLRQKLSDVKSSAGSTDAGADENLRAQLRDMRNEVESLQKEKAALLSSVEKMQREADTSQLKAAGGSWDLEQATRRYQESQREIRRLGALIDETKARCQAEKKDIEYMLFDPEIAKSAQISMLNNLEDKIVEKDKIIKSLEAKQLEKQQPSPEDVKKMVDLQQKVTEDAAVIASLRKDLASAQAVSEEAKKLQELVAQKDTSVASLQAKLAAMQAESQQALAAEIRKVNESQRTVVDSLNAQLKAATDKSLSLEAQLAEVKTKQTLEVQTAAAAKTAELAAQNSAMAVLNTQLKTANDKVALLEGQLAQAKSQIQQAQLAAQIQPSSGSHVPAAPPMASSAPYQNTALKVTPIQSAGPKFMSGADIANLLASTGLTPRSGVQAIQGGDPATYRAYSWKTESMFGSAEMRKVAGSAALPEVAKQYLSRAKSRCQGDFAADESSFGGGKGGIGYEIACVGNDNASSASVLFSYADGIVTTIAHEGRAEAMDMVIDTRDKLAAALAR